MQTAYAVVFYLFAFNGMGHRATQSISLSSGVNHMLSLNGEEPLPTGFGYNSVLKPAVGFEYAYFFGKKKNYSVALNLAHIQIGFEALNSPVGHDGSSGTLIYGDRQLNLYSVLVDLSGSYRLELNEVQHLSFCIGITHSFMYRSIFEVVNMEQFTSDISYDYASENKWGLLLGTRYEHEVYKRKGNSLHLQAGVRLRSMLDFFSLLDSQDVRFIPEYYLGIGYQFGARKRNRYHD